MLVNFKATTRMKLTELTFRPLRTRARGLYVLVTPHRPYVVNVHFIDTLYSTTHCVVERLVCSVAIAEMQAAA